MKNDTIAAITTAPGEAGISVVRISGEDAFKIADYIFRCSGKPPSQRAANSFVHGFVKAINKKYKHNQGESVLTPEEKYMASPHIGREAQDVDEAILLIYKAPHSYTREDVVEIQGHGGSISARRILRTVLNAGARMAEPGEFTRRAFLSGRIDLLQAEAVMDLIRSRSDRAANTALEQLEGSLSTSFTVIYDNLLSVAGDLESTLDFGEDELPSSTFETLITKLDVVQGDLNKLLASWDEGHLLREGALVVLSGSPNVGKSTLLNSLLGSERAIVTHVPGTTRDTLEEQLVLNGIPLRIVDTAGLRDADCDIEKEGIRRAHEKIDHADINIWVVDGSQRLSSQEESYLSNIDTNHCIIVINKSDLDNKLTSNDFDDMTSVSCGIDNRAGLISLKEAIVEKLGVTNNTVAHASISERHRILIKDVLSELKDVYKMLSNNEEDLSAMAAGSVRTALEILGEITGRSYHNDLLENIFGRFCVGK
jgi:tRNA modification GTPase